MLTCSFVNFKSTCYIATKTGGFLIPFSKYRVGKKALEYIYNVSDLFIQNPMKYSRLGTKDCRGSESW